MGHVFLQKNNVTSVKNKNHAKYLARTLRNITYIRIRLKS